MENITNNLQDGLIIMLIGMGVVFLFLTIMVFVMNLTSGIVLKLNEIFPEEVKEDKYVKKQPKDNNDIALAIAIAFAQKLKEK